MLTTRSRWLVPQYKQPSARAQRQLVRVLLVDMCSTQQAPGSGDVPTSPTPEPGTNAQAQR